MEGFFSPLSDIFFWVLQFVHESLNISWSWSIVVLTVIVRIVLVPLTWRQIKSMRAMQALQPQLKALQEKYKDNRQLLNQKVMEFYQANNVSPFSSCLPLLLQMPVFLGLFYMLKAAGEVNGAGDAGAAFVDPVVGWLWISDITKFDLPLMFVYIFSQFAASWQTTRKAQGQQKIITLALPVIIGIMMYVYKWPAGLFIYWFTSNLWTIAQQFVAEKVIPVHVAPVGGGAEGKVSAAVPPSKTSMKTQSKTSTKTPGKTGAKSTGKPGAKIPAEPGAKTPAKTGAKPPVAQTGKNAAKLGGKTSTPSAGNTSAGSAAKSGGKISGQKTGQKGKTTGGASQRPDGGVGGSESAGGA